MYTTNGSNLEQFQTMAVFLILFLIHFFIAIFNNEIIFQTLQLINYRCKLYLVTNTGNCFNFFSLKQKCYSLTDLL